MPKRCANTASSCVRCRLSQREDQVKQLSDDRCCFGLPLRQHQSNKCRDGCNFVTRIFKQAMNDVLNGVTTAERFTFEREMAEKDWKQ